MSREYAEKEREFLGELKADTGRDLGEWMAAIEGLGPLPRNDIIDWLRLQGFVFARASWLERIHHNGGRPIYAGAEHPEARPRRKGILKPAARPLAPNTVLSTASVALQPSPPAPMPAAAPTSAPPAPAPGLDALLAEAKALRPLAQLLVREVEKAVPGTAVDLTSGALLFGRPPFAALGIGSRDLKLCLDLGDQPLADGFTRTRGVAAPAALAHMFVLDDARQVTPALAEMIRQSHLRAQG
jgi:hypothetical protein